MNEEPTVDEQAIAVARILNRHEAARLAMLFSIMTATEKDQVRDALAYMFDLSAYEEQAKRCAALLAQLNDDLAKLRFVMAELVKETKDEYDQLDSMRHDVAKFREETNQRFTKANKFFEELRQKADEIQKKTLFKGKSNA